MHLGKPAHMSIVLSRQETRLNGEPQLRRESRIVRTIVTTLGALTRAACPPPPKDCCPPAAGCFKNYQLAARHAAKWHTHGLDVRDKVAVHRAKAQAQTVVAGLTDRGLEAGSVVGGFAADFIEHRPALGGVATGQPGPTDDVARHGL